MRLGRAGLRGAFVVSAFIAMSASPAGAAWSTALTLSAPGFDASQLATGMNRSGAAAVAWRELPQASTVTAADYRVYAATATPGGGFSRASLGTGDFPGVGVGPDGQVLVAYFDRVDMDLRAAFKPAGGSFGPAVTVSSITAQGPGHVFVGFDKAGNATVYWADGDQPSRLATRRADGTWSSVQVLSGMTGAVAALSPDGDFAAASRGTSGVDVMVRSGPGGPLVHQVIAQPAGVAPLRIVTDEAGDMTLQLVSDDPPRTRWIADRAPGGVFGATQQLPSQGNVRDEPIAMSAGGELLAWDSPQYSGYPAQIRVRPAHASTFGPPETLPPSPGVVALAADSSGLAAAVAVGISPVTDQPSVVALERRPDAIHGPLDVSFPDGYFIGPTVLSAGGPGQAIAAWTRRSSGATRAQVAVRSPAPDPTPPPARPTPVQPAPLDHSAAFQADAAHTGNLEGVGLLPPLTKAWSEPAPASGYNQYVVIDRGTLFVTNLGSATRVVAFDLATGVRRWQTDVGTAQRHLATAQNGTLYVAGGDGLVTALDEATGAKRWEVHTQTGLTRPVVDQGVVYVDSDFSGGEAFALRASDGTLLWGPRSTLTGGDVTVGNGTAFVPAPDAVADAFDATDGTHLWSHYIGFDGGGEALAAFDGHDLWVDEGGGTGGRVYDGVTGDAVKGLAGNGPPALRAPTAYELRDGGLDAIDERTFTLQWHFAAPARLATLPLIVDGLIYVASEDGTLYALDPSTGAVRWQGGTATKPAFSALDTLTLAAGSGHLVLVSGSSFEVFKGAPAPPADGAASGQAPGASAPSAAATPAAAPTPAAPQQAAGSSGARPVSGSSTPPPARRRPAGGSRYRGTTSQGKHITLRVTPDGRGLQMSVAEIARCSPGPDEITRGTYREQRPTIRPDGSFDYRIVYHRGPVPGFAEKHTERHHISGGFGSGAKTVHGRLTVNDVGVSGNRCTTKLTFIAHAV